MGFLNPGLEVRILSESQRFMEISHPAVSRKRNRSGPKAGKITVVVYPSWTREVASSNLAFQTICSISIMVSAFGFLPNDKGSIPLWNTNDFVAQVVRVSV